MLENHNKMNNFLHCPTITLNPRYRYRYKHTQIYTYYKGSNVLNLNLGWCDCGTTYASHCIPVPEPTTMDVIFQFNKLKPPKFQGGADPLKYEEWI